MNLPTDELEKELNKLLSDTSEEIGLGPKKEAKLKQFILQREEKLLEKIEYLKGYILELQED